MVREWNPNLEYEPGEVIEGDRECQVGVYTTLEAALVSDGRGATYWIVEYDDDPEVTTDELWWCDGDPCPGLFWTTGDIIVVSRVTEEALRAVGKTVPKPVRQKEILWIGPEQSETENIRALRRLLWLYVDVHKQRDAICRACDVCCLQNGGDVDSCREIREFNEALELTYDYVDRSLDCVAYGLVTHQVALYVRDVMYALNETGCLGILDLRALNPVLDESNKTLSLSPEHDDATNLRALRRLLCQYISIHKQRDAACYACEYSDNACSVASQWHPASCSAMNDFNVPTSAIMRHVAEAVAWIPDDSVVMAAAEHVLWYMRELEYTHKECDPELAPTPHLDFALINPLHDHQPRPTVPQPPMTEAQAQWFMDGYSQACNEVRNNYSWSLSYDMQPLDANDDLSDAAYNAARNEITSQNDEELDKCLGELDKKYDIANAILYGRYYRYNRHHRRREKRNA